MSAGYKTVGWNPNKVAYDRWLWGCIVLYLAVFVTVSISAPGSDPSLITVFIRALASCAFIMLTVILCIGPLARINRRFLPLLYNRRHFGVSLFFIALSHALLAIFWYHSFGPENPLVSVFVSGGDYRTPTDVPFQALGALALLILFLLASTSHDYWNTNLGAPLWKALHMLIYPAYALVVAHLLFGSASQAGGEWLRILALLSLLCVSGLHLVSALRFSAASLRNKEAAPVDENQVDENQADESWVNVCEWPEIENNRAITVDVGKGERIAVFRYDEDKLSAVANACQHQNGPLGEGCVINGNIVCPWHGYEYRPDDGCSPAPFTEKIPTYHLKLVDRQILVNPVPLPAGTARDITRIPDMKDRHQP